MRKDRRTGNKIRLTIPNNVKLITVRDIAKVYRRVAKYPIKEAHNNRHSNFIAIFSDFVKFIVEQLLLGHTVQLPFRCGWMKIQGVSVTDHIRIEEKKEKGEKFNWNVIDWKKSSEAKAKGLKNYLCYYDHGSIIYKLRWGHHDTRIKNIRFYKFIPSPSVLSLIAEVVREGQEYSVNDWVETKRREENVVNDWF